MPLTRLPNAEIYLVPLGCGRFELYTEPADAEEAAAEPRGFLKSRFVWVQKWWRDAASPGRASSGDTSTFQRWRDKLVCRMAEMIAEHRTLWFLRHPNHATFLYPSDYPERTAVETRTRLLARARRHHGVWGIIDGLLFVASGIFMLVPGPNVIAYYFGLRLAVHYLAWRGARHALDRIEWTPRAEPALAELGRLADVASEDRASRVEAIAAALQTPRLAAFFERAAVPAR